MATRLRITYLDGRVVEVVATPRAQIMTEEHLGGIKEANRLHASYYLGWASLHKAGKEATEFEKWLDLIDDVDEVEPTGEDLAAEDPTPAAQSANTSST
jgi:hypothetical protein